MLILLFLGILYCIYKNQSVLEEKIKNQCGKELEFKIYSKESIIRIGIASLFIWFGILIIGGYLVLGCTLMLISVLILFYEIFLTYKKTNLKYGTIISLVYIIFFLSFLAFEFYMLSIFIMGIAWIFSIVY